MGEAFFVVVVVAHQVIRRRRKTNATSITTVQIRVPALSVPTTTNAYSSPVTVRTMTPASAYPPPVPLTVETLGRHAVEIVVSETRKVDVYLNGISDHAMINCTHQ
jgi:hypothetical protein